METMKVLGLISMLTGSLAYADHRDPTFDRKDQAEKQVSISETEPLATPNTENTRAKVEETKNHRRYIGSRDHEGGGFRR